MSNKNRLSIIFVIITFLAVAFIISFNWGMERFTQLSDNKNTNRMSPDNDRVASVIKAEEIISPDCKVTIKVEYTKSGDIESKLVKADTFVGKNKKSIESEGYIVESMTPKDLILLKKVDTYAPNKYVLGVKDDCFAIYRTDGNGDLYIENEVSDITDIRVPTKGDYNLLVKGSKHFQFNNRDEAEEKLGEYNS